MKKKPTKINSLQDLGKVISFSKPDGLSVSQAKATTTNKEMMQSMLPYIDAMNKTELKLKKQFMDNLVVFGRAMIETTLEGTRIIPQEEIDDITDKLNKK